MKSTERVVIHRGSPRTGEPPWFEIRGRRYELKPGASDVREGWGYEVACEDGTWIDASLHRVEDVRAWAQEYVDHPEWGYPEEDDK